MGKNIPGKPEACFHRQSLCHPSTKGSNFLKLSFLRRSETDSSQSFGRFLSTFAAPGEQSLLIRKKRIRAPTSTSSRSQPASNGTSMISAKKTTVQDSELEFHRGLRSNSEATQNILCQTSSNFPCNLRSLRELNPDWECFLFRNSRPITAFSVPAFHVLFSY